MDHEGWYHCIHDYWGKDRFRSNAASAFGIFGGTTLLVGIYATLRIEELYEMLGNVGFYFIGMTFLIFISLVMFLKFYRLDSDTATFELDSTSADGVEQSVPPKSDRVGG